MEILMLLEFTSMFVGELNLFMLKLFFEEW